MILLFNLAFMPRMGLLTLIWIKRARPPGFLRMPVDARQQVAKLRCCDCHHAIGRARPHKAPALQTLREQASALTVVPDHLQQIASPTAEAEQVTAQGIAPQRLLDRKRQRRKTLAHIRVGEEAAFACF